MNSVCHFIWVAKLIYCEFFDLKFHIDLVGVVYLCGMLLMSI
jgi:hypothetical protein